MWDNLDRMLKDQGSLNRQVSPEQVREAVQKARERLGKKPGEKLIITVSTTMSDWLGIYKRGEKVAMPGQLPHAVRTLDVLLAQLPQYGADPRMTTVLKEVAVQQRVVPQRLELKLATLRALKQSKQADLLPLLYEIQNWKNTVRADRVAETLRTTIGGVRKFVGKIPLQPFGAGYRKEDFWQEDVDGKKVDRGLLTVVNEIDAVGRYGISLRKDLHPAEVEKLHNVLSKMLGRDITPEELSGLQTLWRELKEKGLSDPESTEDLLNLSRTAPQISPELDFATVNSTLTQWNDYLNQHLKAQIGKLGQDIDALRMRLRDSLRSGKPVDLKGTGLEKLHALVLSQGYLGDLTDKVLPNLEYLRDVCQSIAERGQLDAPAMELATMAERYNAVLNGYGEIKSGQVLGSGSLSDLYDVVDKEGQALPTMMEVLPTKKDKGKLTDLNKLGQLGASAWSRATRSCRV